ncbi:hypothetical protein F5Y19DRAFT_435961 [Xylariaceae sp. FL1651]|nr:hypothetical protein F5Y19DRAFT_435961 [Xylariaceae sp. FL1651]
MKKGTTIFRFIPFLDSKGHGTARSWSGFNSTVTSTSSKSSQSTYYNETPQIIHGSWIHKTKLEELLNRKFGSEYRLELRSDDYTLFAKGRLTKEEIMWCAA